MSKDRAPFYHNSYKRNRKKRKKHLFTMLYLVLFVMAVFAAAWFINRGMSKKTLKKLSTTDTPSWVDVQYIDIDGASRRGEKLEGLEDIVVHYIGNPGTTAQQNHDYFANADSSVSAHFVIGLEGEVIQCIPLDEKSSASNWRNNNTISIEVCHPDETGVFTDASYRSLVKLTAWLCELGKLNKNHIIRHFDITGKMCPLYFVENEDAWQTFKQDVALA